MKRRSDDVGSRGGSGALFRNGTMDFLAGWLLGYAQQGGMSPGALLSCFGHIRNGDPDSWNRVFADAAERSMARARAAEAEGRRGEALGAWSAAQVAHRAVLAMTDPAAPQARTATTQMSFAFESVLRLSEAGMRRWEIPFEGTFLPAYVTADFERAKRLIVIVGGGDTYVEDLWFFGGRDAVRRAEAALMVDLPGQGDTPARGLHFGPETVTALRHVLAAVRERGFAGDVILMGWSGGGIFTTHVAATASPADRIVALVASTPVHDPVTFFSRAIPRVLQRKSESLVLRAVLALARRNRVLRGALARYDWQFGPGGIAAVIQKFSGMRTVVASLDVPTLALVGLAEDRESLRQATAVIDDVQRRHPVSRLITFDDSTGAQAHCQVGNLPLALNHIFDWIDHLPATQTHSLPSPPG